MRSQVAGRDDRYDANLSGTGRSCGRNCGRLQGGGRMDRDKRLAVLCLLVLVVVAGVGTLGAVFTGFSFI